MDAGHSCRVNEESEKVPGKGSNELLRTGVCCGLSARLRQEITLECGAFTSAVTGPYLSTRLLERQVDYRLSQVRVGLSREQLQGCWPGITPCKDTCMLWGLWRTRHVKFVVEKRNPAWTYCDALERQRFKIFWVCFPTLALGEIPVLRWRDNTHLRPKKGPVQRAIWSLCVVDHLETRPHKYLAILGFQ